MNRKRSLIAGLVCGLACAVCVALFLHQAESEMERERAEMLARYGGEQVEVCVALRDLAAGETVSAGDVELRVWLADMLPEGAILDRSDVVGRQVSSSILANEVLSERRFDAYASRLEIPYGLSAVSLPARDVQAVGGAVMPGMSVDVYATGSMSTRAIARAALVLDVSESGDGSLVSSASQWITVAVEPQRVQELITAVQTMDLYFVLPGEGVEVEERVDGEAEEGLDREAEGKLDEESVEGLGEEPEESDEVEFEEFSAASANERDADEEES